MLNAMGVSEATNYVATTTLANSRERGTLDQLGWSRKSQGEWVITPVQGTRSPPTSIRRRGTPSTCSRRSTGSTARNWPTSRPFDRDRVSGRVVAGLPDPCDAVASSTRSSRCPASTSGPAASASAPPTGCLRSCTMRSMNPIAPTSTSPGPLSSTRRSVADLDGANRARWAESLLARDQVDAAATRLAAARAVIGDLDLPDSQQRLADLTTQLPNTWNKWVGQPPICSHVRGGGGGVTTVGRGARGVCRG